MASGLVAVALLLLALGPGKDAAAAGTFPGASGARSGLNDPAFRETEELVIGEVDGNVTLACWNASQQVAKVEWFHGNPGVVPILFSSDGRLPSDVRFSLVASSSLRISGLRLQDEGHYTCREEWNGTEHHHKIQLLVASGPSLVNVNISPTTALPNGTLYAKRHDTLNFTCTSEAYPVPRIEWDFSQTSPEKELFTEVNGSLSYFVLYNMSPGYQGNYSCSATNTLSGRQKTVTHELLIYYAPPSAPQCSAQIPVDHLGEVQLFCTWPGGYPHPTLQWTNNGNENWVVNVTRTGDTSMATLHSPRLLHGKEFVCRGSHVIEQEVIQTCSVQLERPSVTSDPMRSCFVRGSTILSCQATAGNPPAKITWFHNASQTQTEVRSGGRFLVSQKANVSTLVIQNCSHSTDEGYYICKAENPLGLKEVYVYLTVTEPENIAGIVGAIVVLCLLGIFILFGFFLHIGPRLCPKGHMLRNRDTSDILVLVDSEEEDPLTEMPGELASYQASELANGYANGPAKSSQSEAPSEIALEEAKPEARMEA